MWPKGANLKQMYKADEALQPRSNGCKSVQLINDTHPNNPWH